jgi:dTDP-glucose 4,6-dehydratase
MQKRILITGSAGFIGHHLVGHLLKNTDWQIVCLDRLDFSGNLNRLQEVTEGYDKTRVKVVHHDLKATVNPQIADAIGKVDYVAHLAAGSHVDRSIDYPMEFVLDNVLGTANILDFARRRDLERFVYFSTDEVFGPAPDDVKYKEYDRYNSTNPYSATKAGGEELVVAYHNTYGLPAIITHTMNVFGERQHPEKYIPMCIQRARDGQEVTIHSNAEKTKAGSRHYIHAGDVASALLHLLKYDINSMPVEPSGVKCQKFNIVGSEELDNLELAKLIAEIQGQELIYKMVDFHSQRPGHDLRYALCGEKMKSIGWEPSSVKDKLAETIKWSLDNKRWLL